jgi:hypothetical protein
MVTYIVSLKNKSESRDDMSSRPNTHWINQFCELRLGEQSRARVLKSLIESIGFQYSGEDTIPGLSGIHHRFDAIGTKGKNILLVVGGAETEELRKRHQWNPRAQMEAWRDRALLSAYDVQATLQLEGFVVDLMFFHNISYTNEWVGFGPKSDPGEWIEKHQMPNDISMSHIMSVKDIPLMSNDELATVAQSIGACFLSLNDLKLDEITLLATPSDSKVTLDKIQDILRRLRVLQYFHPPTDELILSAYDVSKRTDKKLVTALKESAEELGHPPVENVLVPAANFRDPVETAKALEKNKYISFESRVEINESGFKVTQSIRKTAQGSFVVRILKGIGLGDLAKSIIEGIKGT